MGSNNWITVRLKEEIEIKHGYAFKGEYFRDKETDAILLTPGNFKIGGGIKLDKLKYYEGPIPDEYVLQEGDLLITMTDLSKNGDTRGYPAIIPKDISGMKYLHNQRLGKVMMKERSKLDKGFLYWIFRSQPYRDEVLASATGTTVRHTAPKRILSYSVSVPPLLEQQKIASILSSLDDKIELNHQMNRTLEEMAQAIFKSWFVDFEFPNDDEGQPYKSSGGAMVYNEELGKEIPKGWEVRALSDIGDVICGKTPPTKNPENYGDMFLFITIPDMHGNTFIIETEKRLSSIGAATQPKKELPPLSVCVSCIATPGLVSLTHLPSHTNQQINSIVCNKDVSPYFTYLTMSYLSDHITLLGSGGTATLNLNKTNFSAIKILVSDLKTMKSFHLAVKNLFEQILINMQETQTLRQIRDALLPKLLSGEIQVNGEKKEIKE